MCVRVCVGVGADYSREMKLIRALLYFAALRAGLESGK